MKEDFGEGLRFNHLRVRCLASDSVFDMFIRSSGTTYQQDLGGIIWSLNECKAVSQNIGIQGQNCA